MSAQDTYIEGSDIYIYIQVISGESYTFSSSLDLNRFNGKKYESINIDYHIIYYLLFFEFSYLCLLLKCFHIISLILSSYSI